MSENVSFDELQEQATTFAGGTHQAIMTGERSLRENGEWVSH